MNVKRLAVSFLAVFAFVFAFEFLYHGMLMQAAYEKTAHLWRSKEDSKMLFIFLGQLSFAAVLSFIFTLHYEGRGLGEGLRFGLAMGLLVGSIQIGTYCYMPIPLSMMIAWVAAEVIKGLGSGMVLAFTYRK